MSDLTAIAPPATIGMLGGGQLGRYALLAARVMGYRTIVLDPDPRAPAGAIADEHLVAAYDDPAALDRLATDCQVVTTEFENPPAHALRVLSERTRVAPNPQAMATTQDRISEKGFLVAHGLPVGPYGVITSVTDVLYAVEDAAVTYPARLKTARLGYDGKGQAVVGSAEELRPAWHGLGGVPCVLERALDLVTEVSVVAARGADREIAAFAVAENSHVDGVLDVSVVGGVDPDLAAEAQAYATRVAEALDFVGTFAVEFFVTADGLLVNEIAPRPHNSGHWTLDAARTDQFAQQIRAVCGMPLGDPTQTVGGAAMANLLGDVWGAGEPDWSAALSVPGVSLHLYGKAEPRPGRKMGHLTAVADSPDEARQRVLAARSRLARPA